MVTSRIRHFHSSQLPQINIELFRRIGELFTLDCKCDMHQLHIRQANIRICISANDTVNSIYANEPLKFNFYGISICIIIWAFFTILIFSQTSTIWNISERGNSELNINGYFIL